MAITVTRLRFNGFSLEEVMSGMDEKEAYRVSYSELSAGEMVLLSIEYDAEGNEIEKIENKPDSKGRITEQRHFYEGELAETVSFEYNEKDLPVREAKRYADGGEDEVLTTYNTDNRVTERKFRTQDGETGLLETFSFEGKLLLSHTRYKEDGSVEEKTTFRYEKIGEEMEPVEVTHFIGDIRKETRTTYDYSAGGLLTGSYTVDWNSKCIEKNTITYDDRQRETGNLIETPGRTVLRTTTYHDETGVVVNERYVDGVITSRTEEKRNEKGELLFMTTHEADLGFFTEKITREEK